MLAPPSAPDFDDFVDEAVRAAATGARNFAGLLARLPGIGPADALRALADQPLDPGYARLLGDAQTRAAPDLPFDQCSVLPLPHPLDMEWRFTRETAVELLAQAIAHTSAGDAILLLGVPSVAAAASVTRVDREFQVEGEGNIICEALRGLTRGDTRFVHGPAGRRAAAAIVDPPWYTAAYAEMLATCSERCVPGAQVFLALPPVGVRPSARDDRGHMIELAEIAGFAVSRECWTVRYRSPAFELAAWRAAGIGAWLPDWRTGEVRRLVKDRPGTGQPQAPARAAAFEVTIEGVRLRLLLGREGPGELTPIAPGEVVPSVSARWPGRDRAALWTSSNRAFAVDSTLALPALAHVADARGLVLPRGLTLKESAPRGARAIDAIRALTHQIENLAERELAGANDLVGDAAWSRAHNDVRFLSERLPSSPQVRDGTAA